VLKCCGRKEAGISGEVKIKAKVEAKAEEAKG
jgi:hypothetical protein